MWAGDERLIWEFSRTVSVLLHGIMGECNNSTVGQCGEMVLTVNTSV